MFDLPPNANSHKNWKNIKHYIFNSIKLELNLSSIPEIKKDAIEKENTFSQGHYVFFLEMGRIYETPQKWTKKTGKMAVRTHSGTYPFFSGSKKLGICKNPVKKNGGKNVGPICKAHFLVSERGKKR